MAQLMQTGPHKQCGLSTGHGVDPFRSRAASVGGVFEGLGSDSSSVHVFSEVTFPPFGFVMTFDNSLPPQSGFCEISSFAKFDYRAWRTGLQ